MAEQVPTSPTVSGKGKKRALRIVLFALCGLLLIGGILVLLLPSILSSGPGTRFLERFAGGRIAGSISFERLSLSWRQSQAVEGLVVRGADGLEVLSISRMVNDRSLWGLVTSRGEDLGTTTVKGLKADIVADEDGDSNLMKALRVPGPSKKKQTGLVPVLPFGSLVLGDSLVVVSAPGVDPVVFDIPRLNVDLPLPEKPLRVDMEIQTRQGDLTGELKLRALAENVVDARRRLQPLAARLDLEAAATNLPVEGLDGAFGFGGVLSGALGRKADLSIKTKADLTKADLDLSFTSPHLKARIGSLFENGVFSLRETGRADFTVSPALVASLVRRYAPQSSLRLEKDALLAVAVEEMKLSVLPPNLAHSSLTLKAETDGDLHFSGMADGGDLKVKRLHMALDGSSPAEMITVDLSSDLVLDGDPGAVRITSTLSDLLDDGGKFVRDRARIKVDGTLKNVPVAVLEGLAGRDGMMTELLGHSLNAHFSAGNPGKGKTALDLIVESSRFKAETALVAGDSIELVRPVRIQARLTPRLLELAGAGAGLMEGVSDINLGITRMSVPLPREGKGLALDKIDLQAVATAGPLTLTPAAGTSFAVEGTRVEVKADGQGQVAYELSSRISSRNTDGAAPEGIFAAITTGEPVAVELKGDTGFDGNGGIKILTSSITAENSVLNMAVAVTVDGAFTELAMTTPLEAGWFPGETQIAELFEAAPGAYVPRGEMQMKIRVEPAKIKLQGFAPADLKTVASLQLPRLQLSRDGKTEALLENLAVRADFDGGTGVLAAKAGMQAAFPGEKDSYPVDMTVRLENLVKDGALDVPGSALSVDLAGRGLPTALAGIFSDGLGWLPALAGRRADVRAVVRKSPLGGGAGEATVELTSERLQTGAEFSLGETLSLRKPMALTLTLTPASYQALRGAEENGEDGAYGLARNAVVTATVSELRLPTGKDAGLGDLAFKADLKSGEIVLKQKKSGRSVGLSGLTVQAAAQPLSGGVSMEIVGAMSDTKGGTGSLDARLTVRELVSGDGTFAGGNADVKFDARGGSIPVALVDGLLGLGGLAEPALGQSLDLTATAALKGGAGPLNLNATATHARLDIAGLLADGTFTLKKPLVAEVDVTEELGRKLLSKVHPIFETVKTAQEPLRVEIDNRGFVIPVKDFDIAGVTMPRLTVGSNKTIFRKGGTLEMLVLLAGQFGGSKGIGSGKEMEVWFTPLVAEMKNGLFRYSRRLDLLIDGRLHAFTWGSVSLGGESGYDLFLGLPAESLRKVLGTKKISEGEVFTFPLQGREGNVDTKGTLSRASLDLGRLRGQYELSKKDPLLGLVAGQLTKKAIGTDTGPVPPPSVDPFPWAGILPEPESPPPPPPPPPAKQPAGKSSAAGDKSQPASKPSKPQPEEVIKNVLDLFK